jgi:signal transduction histidine kinase
MSVLADVIDAQREAITQRWADRLIDTMMPRALDREAVIDSMREYLAQLTARLRGDPPEPVDASRANEIAVTHGTQRFQLGADIGALVREYGHLRDVLYEVIAEEAPALSVGDFGTLSKHLIDGIADATAQFAAELQQALRRQASRHLGFLAHELRGHVSSVRLAASLLRLADDKAIARRASEKIDRGLVRLSTLIDDALVEVRLEAGVEIEPQPVDVEALLRELIDEVALEAESRGLATRVTIGDGPLELCADPRVLRSAIANLVRNAIKFSRDGGRVEVAAKRNADHLVIEVQDACGGIGPSRISELFDPFVQVGADRSGFGLGLAIAKQAAIAHGGEVRVHDLPGTGCVFTIDLPVTPTPPAA